MRDTIELAREAGFDAMRAYGLLPHVPEDIFIANVCVTEEVKRLVALVRADERDRAMRENAYVQAEREACAKLCDAKYEEFPNEQHDLAYALSAKELAAAIRNRGNT
jgi:hypothetical protein